MSLALLFGLSLAAFSGAYGQVTTINSAVYNPREFNGVPDATLTTVSNYPSLISIDEMGVSAFVGFANRDVWRFSNNGGFSAYAFGNDDFFHVSMTLTLAGTPISPRKEAGFLLSTISGDGQFLVNSDLHEIIAFGGPLPFYAFPPTYNSGDTITLGMTYFLDSNNLRAIIYSANGVNSPALEFSNIEQGIIGGSTLGGYFQIVNSPADPANSGSAVFESIEITVPEPSSVVLAAVGLVGVGVITRRKKNRRAQTLRHEEAIGRGSGAC